MPVVFREGRRRFHFYSADGSEPVHVHVSQAGQEAKFWLEPDVHLASNIGYSDHDLREFAASIRRNRALIERRWHEHFRRQER